MIAGHELVDDIGIDAETECNLAGLELLHADRRVDADADDGVGLLGRDFLDVHAAGSGGYDHDALGGTIKHESKVDFLVDVRAFFDVEARDELAGGARLVRDELAAEERFRRILDFLFVAAELDAAGLAARARMNLGLHDDDGGAEFAGAIRRLLGAVGETAARDRYAELGEKLFRLVLMNVHVWTSLGKVF